MGRPPTNGTPAFRFTSAEVEEMETILQDHNNKMPAREVLVSISDKFSNSAERQGKSLVQTKQIWNWFQNKRHAIRATSSKTPTKLIASSMQSASTVAPPASLVSTVPAMQATPAVPVAPSVPTTTVVSKKDNLSTSGLPQSAAASHGKLSSDNIPMEFEARSARDGAWYDVSAFLSLKNLEAGEPEVLVRFNGFGAEEDEWINVKKNVRHRSLPCETSECVAVLPGDLILCFQEGKEQALYFDAHVLDAQRRRHDVRGCRCRFLVRYEHDQSEEIVQLRKICRRPETEYRLQQLHAMNESSAEQGKSASATQHKTVSSVDQIKPDVDLSFSKTGSSNSVVPSVQNPYAPNLHVNSSVSEELKGAFDYSTDKTAEDMNDAPSSTQHSHPVLIGLEPRDKAERNMLEAKAATDYMAVEETLDKPCVALETTNVMPIYADGTAKTCNTVEQIDGDPRTEHNATEVVTNEAALAAGTDSIAEDGQQDDSEQMVVETNSTTGERRTDIDISEIDPARSTDPHMPAEAKITKTNLPDEAGINIADGNGPEMVSSVSTGVTLESNGDVTEPSAVIDAGKADFDMGNVTLPSAGEDADHPYDDSGTNK